MTYNAIFDLRYFNDTISNLLLNYQITSFKASPYDLCQYDNVIAIVKRCKSLKILEVFKKQPNDHDIFIQFLRKVGSDLRFLKLTFDRKHTCQVKKVVTSIIDLVRMNKSMEVLQMCGYNIDKKLMAEIRDGNIGDKRFESSIMDKLVGFY